MTGKGAKMTTRRRYCGAGKNLGGPGEFLVINFQFLFKSKFQILNFETNGHGGSWVSRIG